MGILWPHSNTVARTNADRRASGALAYFFEAGTTTPRTTYQDAGLTTPHPHPVVADAYGRFPAVFIDFGSYRERVKTAGNTQLWDTDDIPNPAPFDEEVGVDTDALLKTGDIFFGFRDDIRPGAVRANGKTIGSATSGAQERANADCEDLFIELYESMDNTACPVSGGRGANAAADFAANKTITLPDLRGRVPFGLETMGGLGPAGRMSSIVPGYTNSSNAILPGRAVGLNTHQLTTAQLPVITPAGTIASITPAGTIAPITPAGTLSGTLNLSLSDTRAWGFNYQGVVTPNTGATGAYGIGSSTGQSVSVTSGSLSGTVNIASGSFTGTQFTPVFTGTQFTPMFTGTPFGSGAAHNNVPNAVLGTWYIKL